MTNEERVQTENTILKMGGVNRSQARDALSGWAVERQQAQVQREIQRSATPEPPFESIKSTVTTLERKPIQTTGQTQAAGTKGTGGTPVEVGGIRNGVATTFFLLAP